MKRSEYRITRSAPMPFKLQVKRWGWPWWVVVGYYHSIEDAETDALGHAGGVVKNLGSMLEEQRDAE